MAGLPVAEAIGPLLQGGSTGQPIATAARLPQPLESNKGNSFHEYTVCIG